MKRPAHLVAIVATFYIANCVSVGQCASKSEQQRTAELIWAYVTSGGFGEKVHAAADKLAEDFPKSANAALWGGTVRASASQRETDLKDFAKTVSEVIAKEEFKKQPWIPEAERISRRMKEAANKSDPKSRARADLLLLQAVKNDQRCLSAWAALVASDDFELALRAADQWARIDKDNALPLYARAGLFFDALHRDKQLADDEKGRLSDAILEAIRKGNRRSHCTFPQLPFPKMFELEFPADWKKSYPGAVGKPVSFGVLRRSFHAVNEGIRWQGQSPISPGTFRDMDERWVTHSGHLSEREQVSQLHALTRMELHLQRSNSWFHAIASNSSMLLTRLQVIAANQGDFAAVERYHDLREHIAETRRLLVRSYNESQPATATDDEDELAKVELFFSDRYHDIDQDAARIMAKRSAPPELPQVRFRDQPPKRSAQIAAVRAPNQKFPANTKACTVMLHTLGVDYVAFDAYPDSSNDLVVSSSPVLEKTDDSPRGKRRKDGKLYIEDLSQDEIQRVIYRDGHLRVAYLDEQLDLLFELNRTARRNVGAYVVLHADWPFDEILSMKHNYGLVSKQDRLVFASYDENQVKGLYQEHGLRAAWIVSAEKVLTLSAEGLEEFLDARQKHKHAIALDLRKSRLVEQDLLRVAEALKKRGLAVHLIDGPRQSVPKSVRAEVDIIVTHNLAANAPEK